MTKQQPAKSFPLSIPVPSGGPKIIDLKVGEVLFVVGANGSGKSSLLQWLYASRPGDCRRIMAMRQTWFNSGQASLTSASKQNLETNIQSWDAQPRSRWYQEASGERPQLTIYNIIESEHGAAHKIARAFRADDLETAKALRDKPSPIQEINGLFATSNLPIRLTIKDEDSTILATKSGGESYSVAQLSDGERNALLIAGEVLSAKPGTLFVVDEPERHLHRSVISPMLTSLFDKRKDCAFVISTHEVMLPIDQPSSRKLLLRSCQFAKENVASWDFDLVEPGAEADGVLDERLAADLLGARRKVLFVEGTNASLDKTVYGLLFGEASVVAKGNCRDVEQAVTGIRASAGHHWVKAFGIVDNDNRPAAELAELRSRGVYAVPHYSVESLYYHPEIQKRVADRRQKALGGDCAAQLAAAKASVLAAARSAADRFALAVAERRVREELMSKIPKKADFATPGPINIEIKANDQHARAKAELDALVAGSDDGKILCAYPVRESGALAGVAKALGFQGRTDYEEAVRTLLMDDLAARDFLVGLFGSLAADIKAG